MSHLACTGSLAGRRLEGTVINGRQKDLLGSLARDSPFRGQVFWNEHSISQPRRSLTRNKLSMTSDSPYGILVGLMLVKAIFGGSQQFVVDYATMHVSARR